MNRKAKILLHWLVDIPPTGQSPRGVSFSKPARFDHQDDDWKNNAWSLVITTEGNPNKKGEQIAIARFLVTNAPDEWLVVGKRFTLFEGNLALAECLIEEIVMS